MIDLANPYSLANFEMKYSQNEDKATNSIFFEKPPEVDHSQVIKFNQDDGKISLDGVCTEVFGLGYSHIFTGFYQIYRWAKKAWDSKNHFDLEAKLESTLRVFGLPLAILNALDSIILFAMTLIVGASISLLSISALALGVTFLCIELGLEVFRLVSIVKFRNILEPKKVQELLSLLVISPEKDLSYQLKTISYKLKNHSRKYRSLLGDQKFYELSSLVSPPPPLIDRPPRQFQTIQKQLQSYRAIVLENKIQRIFQQYLTITKEDELWIHKKQKTLNISIEDLRARVLQGKEDQFSRRAGYNALQAFKTHRIEVQCVDLQNLEKYNLAFFKKLDLQTQKSIKIHAIGIAAIALGLLLVVLSYLHPPILAIAVGGISFIAQTIRYLAPQSYLNQNDSSFSLNPQKERAKKFFGWDKKVVEYIPLQELRSSN